jgi:hypothetical protein
MGSLVASMGVPIMTHIPSDSAEWLSISMSPPDGQDLEVCVMDYDEIVVPLPYPCHRNGADFVDASNKKRIDIQPTHWRKWTEHRAKGV